MEKIKRVWKSHFISADHMSFSMRRDKTPKLVLNMSVLHLLVTDSVPRSETGIFAANFPLSTSWYIFERISYVFHIFSGWYQVLSFARTTPSKRSDGTQTETAIAVARPFSLRWYYNGVMFISIAPSTEAYIAITREYESTRKNRSFLLCLDHPNLSAIFDVAFSIKLLFCIRLVWILISETVDFLSQDRSTSKSLLFPTNLKDEYFFFLRNRTIDSSIIHFSWTRDLHENLKCLFDTEISDRLFFVKTQNIALYRKP